jgi:hypothetical protein
MRCDRGFQVARLPRLVVLVALGLIGACEGDNLFDVGRADGPRILELRVPAAIRSSSVLDVRVRAIGELRVDSIHVRVRGAFDEDQGTKIVASDLDIIADFAFNVPALVFDTILVVSAVAVDARGNVSPVATDTVRVLDGTNPEVSVSLGSATAVLGHPVELSVSASDNVGLSRLGYQVLGPAGDTIAYDLAATTGLQLDTVFVFTIPETVGVGLYSVQGFAQDVEGNLGWAEAGQLLEIIFGDEEPPTVELLVPIEGEDRLATDSLFVAALLHDNDGIATVRLEGVVFRGNADLGTDSIVPRFVGKEVQYPFPPRDTIVTRFLEPTSLNVSEAASVVVTAIDVQGNVGADTVGIILIGDDEPPFDEVVQPSPGDSVAYEDSVFVQVELRDFWGVANVVLEGLAFRGDPDLGTDEVVERLAQKRVELLNPSKDTVLKRFLVPTGDGAAESVSIVVTATDIWGNVGADTLDIFLLQKVEEEPEEPPPPPPPPAPARSSHTLFPVQDPLAHVSVPAYFSVTKEPGARLGNP